MARSEDLNRKMKEERREKILSGALHLFAVRGLAATKISDIAKQSGMSQGLVYHYYSNKGEIFSELIRSAFERMAEASLSLESLDLPADVKIRMAVEGLVESMKRGESSLNYLLIANASLSEAIPEEAKRVMGEKGKIPYEVMERIFTAGQSEGTVKEYSPRDLATLFWTTLKGVAIHRASHGSEFVFPDTNIILEMFIKEVKCDANI